MYYEKWGFMLIFWNLAGVPLSYCHCTLYLANHAPSVYKWHWASLTFLYALYLFVYWIWDTTNSQKNRFRQQERGMLLERKTFPQLPWQTVKNPKFIKTKCGDSILIDGWCKFPTLPKALLHAKHLPEKMAMPEKYIIRATFSLR
jgi:Delta24(24(1))-sterol reductase